MKICRVEVEAHSSLFRMHGIVTLDDLRKLSKVIYPKHLRFVRVNWIALEAYLSKHCKTRATGRDQRPLKRSAPLHKLMDSLRYTYGVNNPHRFLVPMRINKVVLRALRKWARTF